MGNVTRGPKTQNCKKKKGTMQILIFPNMDQTDKLTHAADFICGNVLVSKLHSPILTRVLIVWPIIFQFPRVSSFMWWTCLSRCTEARGKIKTSKSRVRLPYREKKRSNYCYMF